MIYAFACSHETRWKAFDPSLAAATFLLLLLLFNSGFSFRFTTEFDSIAGWSIILRRSIREFGLVDIVDHLNESLLNIDVATCACFEIHHVIVSCQLLSFLSCHCTFVSQIALVANEESGDICITILVNGHDPSSYRLERLWLCQIEADPLDFSLAIIQVWIIMP